MLKIQVIYEESVLKTTLKLLWLKHIIQALEQIGGDDYQELYGVLKVLHQFIL